MKGSKKNKYTKKSKPVSKTGEEDSLNNQSSELIGNTETALNSTLRVDDAVSNKNDSKGSNKNVKLNVLSNHKISLLQNDITEMLRSGKSDPSTRDLSNSKGNLESSSSTLEKIVPVEVIISECETDTNLSLHSTNEIQNDTECTKNLNKTSPHQIYLKEFTHGIEKSCETTEKLNETSPNVEVGTKRRGRKRKNIDYTTLAEGQEEGTFLDDSNGISVGKRKRGRPKAKGVASKPSKVNAKGLESNSEVMSKGEDTAIEIISDEEDANTIKKKKPRGRYASQQSKLLNTVFQQINTNSNLPLPTDSNGANSLSPLDNISLHSSVDIDDKADATVEDKLVTCAICKLQFTKLSWTSHKYRSHNNLAWKVGEPPLDLNDHTVVMSILSDLYKRKKPLYCEHCGIVKKSALGYLSHKSVCQKSPNEVNNVRIKCEYCEHTVLPVSMTAHLKNCKGLHLYTNTEVDYPENPLNVVEELNTTSTSKRKAASRAENIFKELQSDETTNLPKKIRRSWYVNFDFHPTGFGKKRIKNEIRIKGSAHCWFTNCNFQSSDLVEMENHIWKCSHKIIHGYTCKTCMFTFENEDQIIEHTKSVHSKSPTDATYVEEQSDDMICDIEVDDLNENLKKNPNLNKKVLLNGISFLLKQRYYPTSAAIRYPPAPDWSLQFCKQNFINENLFPSWKVTTDDYEKLDLNMYSKYIPSQKYSICTASIESTTYINLLSLNHQWKRYKLFESDLLYDGNMSYVCEILNLPAFSIDSSTIFCGGPVCAMAWAPTPFDVINCEQVLAISVNNKLNKGYPVDQLYKEPGIIQFWNCGSLLNHDHLIEKPKLEYCIAHDHGPIWCMEWCPSGTYNVDGECYFMQRLGLLAVGSADSYVYIYCICLPALNLFHLNDGKRWVMSGSLDRSIKYWDLDNPTVPISNFTKYIVTDGVWLNHWLSTVHTYDDSCGGGLTYSSVYQLRNYESESTSIMHSNSHVSTISGSEWINGFVQGNVVGEVAGFFPHQLFYALESDKSFRKKKAILGYARLVERNLTVDERLHRSKPSKKGKPKKPETKVHYKVDVQSEDFPHEEYIEPSSYEEADEKYGLAFCDMNLVSLNDLPANLSSYYKSNDNDKLFPSKPNIYPLQLVNKIVINPNHNSYLYYATGYQAGLVRISSLKFINKRRS
ncbi:hypothetical protein RI129_004870 [Pyrocoelia pectoralis]|uniref:C2H2-type domain-containing protein n=1 Tax=Pyrocoelia pectoralis TaxID=417401 RepID=A0AAN7VJ30_9COLE